MITELRSGMTFACNLFGNGSLFDLEIEFTTIEAFVLPQS